MDTILITMMFLLPCGKDTTLSTIIETPKCDTLIIMESKVKYKGDQYELLIKPLYPHQWK